MATGTNGHAKRMHAPKNGMRIGGKFYRGGSLLPKRYEKARPKDPAEDIENAPPNFGRDILPTILTYAGRQSTVSHIYRNPDQAIKESAENARFMRNDTTIMECLEARQRATALLNWHLEPEDKKDKLQKKLVEELTPIIRATPNFTEYRRNLLEALWYGRYGIQASALFEFPKGKPRRTVLRKWSPIMGDKLLFRWDDGTGEHEDGEVGIRVGGTWNFKDAIAGDRKVEYTDQGPGYFLEPWERRWVVVHKHIIEDGAYEDSLSAGRIHGVGIRDRIYWTWFQKQETMAHLMEVIERTGTGFTIYYYPSGNAQAKAEVAELAKQQSFTNIILMPRMPGDPTMDAYGIDRIEPSTAGITALQEIVHNLFGAQIKRYVLGQLSTSEAVNGGIGSGQPDLHAETFGDIIAYDAVKLEETITRELVTTLKEVNFAWARDIPVFFKIDTKSTDSESKLMAYKSAWEMGAKLKSSDVMDIIGASMPTADDETLFNPSILQQVRLWQQQAQQAGGGAQQPGSISDLFGPLASAIQGQQPPDGGDGGQPAESPDEPPQGGPQQYAKQDESRVADTLIRQRLKAIDPHKPHALGTVRDYWPRNKELSSKITGLLVNFDPASPHDFWADGREIRVGATVLNKIQRGDRSLGTRLLAEISNLAELYDHTPPRRYAKPWHEEDHPRGQPENAGEFGPGGGEEAATDTQPSSSSPSVQSWAAKKFKNPEHAKNFATWFGDSKVVDDKGQPLVVYHGTNDANLKEFRDVAYLTPDKSVATQYGQQAVPFYVSASKVFKPDKLSDVFEESGIRPSEENRFVFEELDRKKVRDALRSKGWQAIDFTDIAPNSPGDKTHRAILVLDTAKVKSASGNRGTFDPDEANIKYAKPLHVKTPRSSSGQKPLIPGVKPKGVGLGTWKEELHPRDHGKFALKEGATAAGEKPTPLFGEPAKWWEANPEPRIPTNDQPPVTAPPGAAMPADDNDAPLQSKLGGPISPSANKSQGEVGAAARAASADRHVAELVRGMRSESDSIDEGSANAKVRKSQGFVIGSPKYAGSEPHHVRDGESWTYVEMYDPVREAKLQTLFSTQLPIKVTDVSLRWDEKKDKTYLQRTVNGVADEIEVPKDIDIDFNADHHDKKTGSYFSYDSTLSRRATTPPAAKSQPSPAPPAVQSWAAKNPEQEAEKPWWETHREARQVELDATEPPGDPDADVLSANERERRAASKKSNAAMLPSKEQVSAAKAAIETPPADSSNLATHRWLAKQLFLSRGVQGAYTTGDQKHWIQKAKAFVAANPQTPQEMQDAIVNFASMKGQPVGKNDAVRMQKLLDTVKGKQFVDELPKAAPKKPSAPQHTIRDVTPEGYGPTTGTTDLQPEDKGVFGAPTDENALSKSINEGETLLRGKVSGPKRAAIQKSVDSAKAKLKDAQGSRGYVPQPSAEDIDKPYGLDRTPKPPEPSSTSAPTVTAAPPKPITPEMSTHEKEQILGDEIRERIVTAPTFQKLLAAVKSHAKSIHGSVSDEWLAEKMNQPWDFLSEHSGVMNASSARAKTLKSLADAVIREANLPMQKPGKYRGMNYRIDWDKLNEQQSSAKEAEKPFALDRTPKPAEEQPHDTTLQDKLGGKAKPNEFGKLTVHDSVAALLKTLSDSESAHGNPDIKRMSEGSRMMDLSSLPISKKAAGELAKRGFASVSTIKTTPKFGEGLNIAEPGKSITHIFLTDKGKDELRKYNISKEHTQALDKAMSEGRHVSTRVLEESPEHLKRAIEEYQPSKEPPGYGDLVQTRAGVRGIMQGGNSEIGASRVKVRDPFEARNATYEDRDGLVKLTAPNYEEFKLDATPVKAPPKPAEFATAPGEQQAMFHGLNDLPGQGKLFQGLDKLGGEPQPWKPNAKHDTRFADYEAMMRSHGITPRSREQWEREHTS